MKNVWVVNEGAYYSDIASVEIVFSRRKDAEAHLRANGFKHSAWQDLWLDGAYWCRIEKVPFVEK